MTSRDFCFWLQGLFELANPQALTAEQTAAVKRHLALVFKHEIDPSMGDKAHQAVLDALHDKPQQTSAPHGHHDSPVYKC
jgi:hypothetical protein